jgi:hypothetical protein
MGARREVLAVVAERYRSAGRREKGCILDELTATTGWHRKHALRALSAMDAKPPEAKVARCRGRKYDTDGTKGSFRSCLRQAACGDDPDLA